MKQPKQPKAGKPHKTGKSSPAPQTYTPRLGRGVPHHQARTGHKQRKAPPHHGGPHLGRAVLHQPKPRKAPKQGKKRRGLAGAPVAGGWLLGGNDVLDTCVAVAVANHRLWATGRAWTDAEIVALAGAGQRLEDVLEAAGCEFWPVEPDDGWPLVLGVDLPGPHAVFGFGEAWVSWGGLIRPVGVVEEAWWVEWPH